MSADTAQSKSVQRRLAVQHTPRERPILFSAPMVRALLAGTKTQTRRAVAFPRSRDSFVLEDHGDGWWPYQSDDGESSLCNDGMEHPYSCPHGQPGDKLWVRESFIHEPADYCWEASVSIPCRPASSVYRADHEGDTRGAGWTPSIHMPRWASRITLEITGVRVERLQDISEADAVAEGIEEVMPGRWRIYGRETDGNDMDRSARDSYRSLWEQIHGHGSWDENPWVWCIEFRRLA